jgi:lysozyme
MINPPYKIGPNGLALLKSDESLRLNTYDDATGLPVILGTPVKGKLTIGYGHTGADVKHGQSITEEYAEWLLQKDVIPAEQAVNLSITVPITQNQFDALVCFTFNVGVGAFKASTLLKVLNTGNFNAVPAQFKRWVRSGGKVMSGLVKRRNDEIALFEKT